jgi:CBS domain-containing protein
MHVSDILSRTDRQVFAIDHEQPLRDAVRLMRDEELGAIVVLKATDSRPLGILSRRDLHAALSAMGSSALAHCASGIMRRPAPPCALDATLDEAVAQMRRHRTEHLLVARQAGEIVGMISLGEIAEASLAARETDPRTHLSFSPNPGERAAA